MNAIGIARSGLDAAMMRLTASASNIANAQSTGPVPGSTADTGDARVYRPVRTQASALADGGVSAQMVRADPGYRLTYDPASLQADARGMVAAPDVDVTDELVETLTAKLAFEANLKVIGTASELERRTTELWG
ncbi:MAG: flagellar biosynthesis protein FlgC [Sphingobium sp.]|nr:flagellar biosynthesis protein FlgC [Sphingobium sp.]